MLKNNRKAFTMLEIVFVIVVIGILSAVAIPKFAITRDDANIAKAKATLAAVRSSIATERQKQILRGVFTGITDLGDATNVFSVFNGGTEQVLQYPIVGCTERECWERVDATNYRYHLPVSGVANFALVNNRLDCSDVDTTNCQLLTD